MKPEIFKIDSESESALYVEHFQIKIKTEFTQHFAKKDKIRKKKQQMSSDVQISAGKEGNDKVLGIALKSETQVGTVLESQVIEQQIKSENNCNENREQRKNRKFFHLTLDTKEKIKKACRITLLKGSFEKYNLGNFKNKSKVLKKGTNG